MPVVHLRRHRQRGRPDRRDAGVRRHRAGRLLPRPGRGRGRDHRAHRGRSCRCTSTATRRTWTGSWRSPTGTGCRSSRTPRRRTARRCTATPVGAFGTFAMFCLYPTKNMTSGEGGMVSVANAEIERLMRLLRNQGMEQQYENEVVGFNTRMTDIHAAIGRVQLTKVAGWTEQRQENAAFLTANLRGRRPRPPVRRRRGARLPPVHDAGARRTATGSPRRCARSTASARGVLPGPEPPAAAVRAGSARRPARDRAGRRASACRCRCTPRCRQDDLERIVDGGQRARRRRVPEWRTCAPA